MITLGLENMARRMANNGLYLLRAPDFDPSSIDGVEGTDVVGVRVSTILVEGNDQLRLAFLEELSDVLGDLVSLPEVWAILCVFLVKNRAFDVVFVAHFLQFGCALATLTRVITPGEREHADLDLVLHHVLRPSKYFENRSKEEGLIIGVREDESHGLFLIVLELCEHLDGEEAVNTIKPKSHKEYKNDNTAGAADPCCPTIPTKGLLKPLTKLAHCYIRNDNNIEQRTRVGRQAPTARPILNIKSLIFSARIRIRSVKVYEAEERNLSKRSKNSFNGE
ncbi:short-chain dehydrogenase [Babesia caballi]|uniref:Short-chain dehydrogenase n=1 Tax=Babesia caballi TaxID=5871 RepID=A0AAV4LM74_BABCB|nr:short-chain dehydrogenase [Babesia caballi]